MYWPRVARRLAEREDDDPCRLDTIRYLLALLFAETRAKKTSRFKCGLGGELSLQFPQ